MQYSSPNYPKYIEKEYSGKYYQYDASPGAAPASAEFIHLWSPDKNEVTLMRSPTIPRNYYKENAMLPPQRNNYADDHIYEGLD